jgi:thiamine-phosphate pyrophosphorylase
MIYALIDKETLLQRKVSLCSFVKKLNPKTVPLLQYRNKLASLEEQREDLRVIRHCYHGKLIINDQLLLIDEADGLHLGQEDIRQYSQDLSCAVQKIREVIGEKILGLSTHNEMEILQANKLDLNYIGLGAYRGTTTKKDAKILGDHALELAKLSKHPVALIGGVKRADRFGDEITYRVIGSDLYES